MKLVRIALIALLLVVSTASIPSSAHAHSRRASRSTAAPAQSNPEVERLLTEAADRFQLMSRERQIKKIAWCESKYNAHARNGSHLGVFQQKQRYWSGRVRDYNANVAPEHRVSGNIYDAESNIMVSVRMMGLPGGMNHWKQCL